MVKEVKTGKYHKITIEASDQDGTPDYIVTFWEFYQKCGWRKISSERWLYLEDIAEEYGFNL